MTENIRNLWPASAIQVDILTPEAILLAQASLLEKSTKGLLRAEVTSDTAVNGLFLLHLDIIAPILNHQRHRLITVSRKPDDVYPVHIEHKGTAYSQEDFERLVAEVLQSSQTTSTLESLIARSKERARRLSSAASVRG